MIQASPGELLFIPSPVLRLLGEDIEFGVTSQGRAAQSVPKMLAIRPKVSAQFQQIHVLFCKFYQILIHSV